MKPCCIAISATDPTSGAGAQLDSRLLEYYGIHAINVVSGITVQDVDKFHKFYPIEDEVFIHQLNFSTTKFDAKVIKIGMLGDKTAHVLSVIYKRLTHNHLLVIDPVLASSSGIQVSSPHVLSKLFKDAFLVTPNIPEIEIFLNRKINNETDMYDCVKNFYEIYQPKNVLLKTGHMVDSIYTDLLYDGLNMYKFDAPSQYIGPDVHGTGCFLSTAISAYLTKGFSIIDAIANSKKDIVQAMNNACSIGQSCRKVFSDF